METVRKKVEDLIFGNRVDPESCPFLKTHPSATSEYAEVAYVARETPNCVVIGYEGIDHIDYRVGTVLQVRQPSDVHDPAIKVQLVGGPEGQIEWRISQYLTDRWGNLNYHNAENKPLEFLEDDGALLERLRSQMWDEITFVVRKDGQFGILFEVEYSSIESDGQEASDQNDQRLLSELKPHAEVVAALKQGMLPLAKEFPGVLFAVPDEAVICMDRPAAWAFVPDGLLTGEQREKIGKALLSL